MKKDYTSIILSLAQAKANVAELERRYGPMIAELQAAKNYASTLEKSIRNAALSDFYETGERKFHDALDVKLVAVKSYDTKGNFANAFTFAPAAIVVDSQMFRQCASLLVPALRDLAPPGVLQLDEKYLKALAETPDGKWVTAEERREPRVYLSSRLGAYLIESEFGANPNDEQRSPKEDSE